MITSPNDQLRAVDFESPEFPIIVRFKLPTQYVWIGINAETNLIELIEQYEDIGVIVLEYKILD
jgi:hypothetical protein